MGGFRGKAIICATVISAAVLLAAPLARAQERGPLALASARVCKHVGPPFFASGLLRVRP